MPDSVPAWLKSVLKKPQATTTLAQEDVVADTPPVEPNSLARRIQSLIQKLPTPSAPSPTVTSTSTATQSNDANQVLKSPVVDDRELVQVLSSPVIMNRTLDGGPSIWSMLEEMGSPRPQGASASSQSDVSSDMFSDTSSVMVYSPLLPVQGSLVELAESEVILEEEEREEEVYGQELSQPPPIPGWSWANTLPSTVTSWFTQSTTTHTPTPPPVDEHGQLMSPRTRERRLRAQRAWVPSKEQISIQCMWWGYRLFLPPPVLDILDDQQLEATRRAAMITTALSWFFSNLPIGTLPLPLRPTLLLLQQLTPFLGSIGTFISWSWGLIKGYDQGYGVTLTATWLLPIALIPGTWFERDWPFSPPPPDMSPLPSDTASTPHQPSSTLSSPATIRGNDTLPTPDSTPTPRAHTQLLPSPQPTSPASLHPGSPLPSNMSHVAHVSHMTTRSFPDSTSTSTSISHFLLSPQAPSPSLPPSSPLPSNVSYILQSPPPNSPHHYPDPTLTPLSPQLAVLQPTSPASLHQSSPLPSNMSYIIQSPPPMSPNRYPDLIPTPTPHLQYLPVPQPTSPSSFPSPALPSNVSYSPHMSPRTYPDSPGMDTISSPALSFVTAPNSPAPPSPKRFKTNLKGLVAKSPIVRLRHRNKQSTSSSSPLNPSSHLSPSPFNTNNMTLPSDSSSFTPYATSTPLPYHHDHLPHLNDDHHSPMNMQPSPPAHPNDVWLLQSPLWQCSPLPPEQPLYQDS